MAVRVLVSACLGRAGFRYDGREVALPDDAAEILAGWRSEGRLVALCPEVAAGLGVPRAPVEITRGTAADVLARRGAVTDAAAGDVSEQFRTAAAHAVRVAAEHDIKIAVLTDGSPSCGSTYVHAGRFDGSHVTGSGVVTQALRAAGVVVYPHSDLAAADAALRSLDARTRAVPD